jgi:hypothetical protein
MSTQLQRAMSCKETRYHKSVSHNIFKDEILERTTTAPLTHWPMNEKRSLGLEMLALRECQPPGKITVSSNAAGKRAPKLENLLATIRAIGRVARTALASHELVLLSGSGGGGSGGHGGQSSDDGEELHI